MTTFVYEGTEVKKTGRFAVKERKSSRVSNSLAQDTLVEIEPVDPDITWKKWVNEIHLYEVKTGVKNV